MWQSSPPCRQKTLRFGWLKGYLLCTKDYYQVPASRSLLGTKINGPRKSKTLSELNHRSQNHRQPLKTENDLLCQPMFQGWCQISRIAGLGTASIHRLLDHLGPRTMTIRLLRRIDTYWYYWLVTVWDFQHRKRTVEHINIQCIYIYMVHDIIWIQYNVYNIYI